MIRQGIVIKSYLQKDWVPYAFPFVLFLLLTEPARFFPAFIPLLYFIKTLLVALLLWHWRHKYKADLSSPISLKQCFLSILCGLVVLVIWIVPENYFFKIGESPGFNPYSYTQSSYGVAGLITIRIIGASLVVPLMEELFWRSFLMRYLISADFRSVPLGTFSWFAFLGTAILFGLEHNRVIVGIIAGLLYGLLMIYQKNLKGVILAHGVTNLGLGVYIVLTGNYQFW